MIASDYFLNDVRDFLKILAEYKDEEDLKFLLKKVEISKGEE